MKIKNTNMNMNRRYNRRSTEKARAVTKAKARKTNILLVVAAFGLAAVIGVSAFAFSMLNGNSVKAADTAPASISMKADANKAAQNTRQEAQTATQAPQNSDDQAAVQVVQTVQNDNSVQSQPAQSDTQSKQDKSQAQDSEDNIKTVNGERIYVDNKRTAPEKTGTPATYCANGKTSYGFDWDYSADNGNFVLNGSYNFDQQQYIFTFYGSAPGVSHVTLYYNTDDSHQDSVSLTVTVDNDLNVSIA